MQNISLPFIMKKPVQYSCFSQILLIALSIFVFSCSDDTSLKPKTVSDLIIEDSNFSTFYAAVKHAEMVDALKSGNFTVFAPTNEAFEASGYTSAASITSLSKDSVRTIVSYHIIPGKILKSDIITSQENSQYTTQAVEVLFVSNYDSTLYVNGVKIIQKDINIDNGVMHVIDRVLAPPHMNLFQYVFSAPEFSFLTAAIVRAPAPVMSLLNSTTSVYTLLAANNEAFTKSGYPTIESVQAENPEKLSNILQYNLVQGRLFTGSIIGDKITPLKGSNILVTTNNGIKLTGTGNSGQPALLTQPNMMTKNGVIHYIDRLLLP